MDTLVLLLLSGLSVGALYYLLASGLSLIFGLMSVLSFAHGAMLTASAYTAIVIMTNLSSPSLGTFLVALIAAVVAGGLLAYVVERLLVRPMYSRGHLDQLLVTMGAGLIIVAFVETFFGPDERTMPLPSVLTQSSSLLGAMIPNNRFLLIGAAVLLHLALTVFLSRTRHGLIVRAGVENSDMVRGMGINLTKSFALVFTIGGMAAGLAGALSGVYLRAATPLIGDTFLIYAFIVIVIGGLGSLKGAAIAAVAVGLVQQFSNYYVASGAGDILALVLLALVLLFRPQGLLGKKGRAV